MKIQEPRVEFVPISPEMVAAGSTKCDINNYYGCPDENKIVASWAGCGCSDGVVGDLTDVECNETLEV